MGIYIKNYTEMEEKQKIRGKRLKKLFFLQNNTSKLSLPSSLITPIATPPPKKKLKSAKKKIIR